MTPRAALAVRTEGFLAACVAGIASLLLFATVPGALSASGPRAVELVRFNIEAESGRIFRYAANPVILVVEHGGLPATVHLDLELTLRESGVMPSKLLIPLGEAADQPAGILRVPVHLDTNGGSVLKVSARIVADGVGRSRSRRVRLRPESRSDVEARIDRVADLTGSVGGSLADRMATLGVPGVSVALIEGGRIDWIKSWGTRIRGATGRKTRVNAGTRFQAGSISKPTAGLGVLVLAEKGIVDLNTPANDYLKIWKIPNNEFTARRAVTLRHLITHTGGFTLTGFRGYAADEAIPTLPQILDGLPPANSEPIRVSRTPGTVFSYSGGGITVMQATMSDAAGAPFDELMAEEVFAPLLMFRSTYEQPLPPDLAGEAAWAHSTAADLQGAPGFAYPEQAAAGLWSTPADLARQLVVLMESFGGAKGRIVKPRTARRMVTDHMGGMGFAWFLDGSGTALRAIHGGSVVGARASARFYPRLGQGAVIMTNGSNGDQLFGEIAQALGVEYAWP